jgi:hypothetical protein
MARASATVRVEPESVLADRSFVTRRGELRGWLAVGDRDELAVYGAPDALLRLDAGLVVAADRAERLVDHALVAAAAPAAVVGAYGAGRVVAAS